LKDIHGVIYIHIQQEAVSLSKMLAACRQISSERVSRLHPHLVYVSAYVRLT